MDQDEPPFVDFKCGKCQAVLCKENGKCIRLHIDGYLATIWVAQIELRCSECRTDRTWFQRERYERKRILKSH